MKKPLAIRGALQRFSSSRSYATIFVGIAAAAAFAGNVGVGCSPASKPTESVESLTQPLVDPLDWQLAGPRGILGRTANQTYSGVVFDISVDSSGNDLFVATNGGGAFKYDAPNFVWKSLVGNLKFHSIRGLWVRPTMPNTIVVATGNAIHSGGPALPEGGVYRTTDGGVTWTAVTGGPPVGTPIYRVVAGATNDTLYITGEGGIWRSTSSGATFTRPWFTSGTLTDLAIDPSNANIMYAAEMGVGIRKTINGGTTWTTLGVACASGCTTDCAPVVDRGRMTLAISPSTPSTIYVITADGSTTRGLWRSTNSGSTWCNMNLPASGVPGVGAGQGDRNQMLAVAPKAVATDPDVFIAGGKDISISRDGGATYRVLTAAPPPGNTGITLHADAYVVRWRNSQSVYVGTDGGIYYSTDGGITWKGDLNKIPNLHGLGLDVSNSGAGNIWANSWDNGGHVSGFTSFSDGWFAAQEGQDGIDVMVDPTNGNAGVWGSFGSPPVWVRRRSADQGQSWTDVNVGSVNVEPYFANDRSSPIRVFTNTETGVFLSTAPYTSWTPYPNAAQALSTGVGKLSVTKFSASRNGSVIYAPTGATGTKLKVYDNGWSERSTGLPATPFRVAVPESGESPVFAIMYGGASLANNQKIWRSTDNGQTWTALASGGSALPADAGLMDLAIHPRQPRKLYLATTHGVFKSDDQGATWLKTTSAGGLPEGSYVSRLKIWSPGAEKYWLFAQTWGHSVWKRDISLARYGDFDGDRKADLVIWRPSELRYYIAKSSGGGTLADIGASNNVPVPADYDGDGRTDPAVWLTVSPLANNAAFWILRSSDGVLQQTFYGARGDVPVPADYDGDGKADLAYWHPSDSKWNITKSSDGTVSVVAHGAVGDVFVPSDYDGDGKADIAVWRPSDHKWYTIYSGGGSAAPQWGQAGDLAVPSDYDGDGKADIAVWRPSDHNWYISYSSGITPPIVAHGDVGDVPVPADYDGDGKTDIAVWRPTDHKWYIVYSSGIVPAPVAHGDVGDVAATAAEADMGCGVDIGSFASCNAKCIGTSHPNGGYCPYRHATRTYNQVACFCNP